MFVFEENNLQVLWDSAAMRADRSLFVSLVYCAESTVR
jgi:hypothetical protein